MARINFIANGRRVSFQGKTKKKSSCKTRACVAAKMRRKGMHERMISRALRNFSRARSQSRRRKPSRRRRRRR